MSAITATSEFSSEFQPQTLLLLSAAPKPHGFTGRMEETFLAHTPHNITVERVNLFEEAILSCRDCKACRHIDGCVLDHQDSCAGILSRALGAQYLAVSSPIYFLSYPAPLKAFCDRLQQYFTRKVPLGKPHPVLKRRRGVLLTCCGSQDPFGLQVMEKTTQMMFSCLNMDLAGTWALSGTDTAGLSQASDAQAHRQALRLWKNLQDPLANTQI